jgi:magnesium-transporting ATPase (P-type)
MPIKDVSSQLETQIERGLTQVEAEKRLKEYGPNELSEKSRSGFYKMLF